MKKKQIFYFILLLFTVYIVHSCIELYNYEDPYDKNGFPINPVFYENFLSDDDINVILNSCNNFSRSTVKNPDGTILKDKQRTSTTCFVPNSEIDASALIKKKIKSMFNIDYELEGLQITKYNGGEFYNPHHDYFVELPPEKKQRLKTIFVYLKEPIEGGETIFPIINKKFAPKKGGAVMWTNCYKKNNGYVFRKKSFHGGSPVKKGEKIGLNIWLLG